MKFVLLLVLAGHAAAGIMGIGVGSGDVDASINGTAITPLTVSASTGTFALSGATTSAFPYSPLMVLGNANTYLQMVIQNLSNGNNASGDLVITNDLGNDGAFYLDMGINSSKFSQAGQSVEASSSTFLASSDSDLVLWAGTNGGANNAASETVIIGSSNPVTGNRAAVFSVSSITLIAPVTVSSAAFLGTHVSTQTAGGAGSAVTALCANPNFPSGTYATGGGCSCTGGVAITGTTSTPNCVTANCVATGWTCQQPGGTGGACAAFANCSRAQ